MAVFFRLKRTVGRGKERMGTGFPKRVKQFRIYAAAGEIEVLKPQVG
jgi:hypothetical protein